MTWRNSSSILATSEFWRPISFCHSFFSFGHACFNFVHAVAQRYPAFQRYVLYKVRHCILASGMILATYSCLQFWQRKLLTLATNFIKPAKMFGHATNIFGHALWPHFGHASVLSRQDANFIRSQPKLQFWFHFGHATALHGSLLESRPTWGVAKIVLFVDGSCRQYFNDP